jgi:hypothetical protein
MQMQPQLAMLQRLPQEEDESPIQMMPQLGIIQRQEAEVDEEPIQMQRIQLKVVVGQPGDKYEQEADSVAAQVMSMSVPAANSGLVQRQGEEEETPLVQRSPLADSITPLIQRQSAETEVQRKCAKCEQEEQEEPVQTKSLLQRAAENGSNKSGSNIESQLSNSQGGGSPLPDNVRGFMEPRFGADFSQVRVHTDSAAVQMNKELGAQAFTHGNDIYFNSGKYNPGSSDGKQLLAHELTHTIQQTGAVQAKLQPGEKYEEEAEQMAEPIKAMPTPVEAKGAEVEAQAQSSNQSEGKLAQKTQPAATTETKSNGEVAVPKPEVAPATTTETKLNREVTVPKPEVAPAPTVPGGETQQLPQEKTAEAPVNTEQKAETGNIGTVDIQTPDLSQADQGTSLTDMWQQQQEQMNHAGDVAQDINSSQEPTVALEQALQQAQQKIASIPQPGTDVPNLNLYLNLKLSKLKNLLQKLSPYRNS